MPVGTFIEQSNRCLTVEALAALFSSHLRLVGVDLFAYRLSSPGGNAQLYSASGDFLADWLQSPPDGVQDGNDHHIYGRRNGVFYWKPSQKTPSPHNVMAAEPKAGARVSLHLGQGRVASFGFASLSVQEFSRDQLSQLYAIAGQFQLVRDELTHREHAETITLTDRQKEVLRWAAAGKSNSAIGVILGISEDAVDYHFRNIFRKLECNDRVVAVLRALDLALISGG